jgi:hypothetical protein
MSVYSITCGDLTYYGSTTQLLRQRKAEHKYCYKNKPNKYRSSLVFAKGEETNTKPVINLIEEVDGTYEDLLNREKWFIANHECVNHKAMTLAERKERRRKRYLEAKLKSCITI